MAENFLPRIDIIKKDGETENDIIINITPRELVPIDVRPRVLSKIPLDIINDLHKEDNLLKETISKIYNIGDHRIKFFYQETPANCGPLAVVNGMVTLAEVSDKFVIPEDFPKTSKAIRDYLIANAKLRRTSFTYVSSDEISNNDKALESGHIRNLVHDLSLVSNLVITGDRFASGGISIPTPEIPERVSDADWVILNKGYHYVSFVKASTDEWLFLDSVYKNGPQVVTTEAVIDICTDTPESGMTYFMTMKVVEKNKINIVRKN